MLSFVRLGLGLRARIAFAFGLGGFLLSALLSLTAYSVTRTTSLDQRAAAVERQFFNNASFIQNASLTENASYGEIAERQGISEAAARQAKNIDELAATLGLSLGTVKSRLARAHLALENLVRTRFPHLDLSDAAPDSVGGAG